MNTFHDFSDLGELLRVLPARLRLVADYVSREDALEREAAAELLDSGHVAQDGEIYSITEKGRRTCAAGESSLSPVVRRRCDQRMAPLNQALKRKAQVRAEVQKQPQGFDVRLAMDDDQGSLFSLTLLAPSEEEGQRIAQQFLQHPDRIYNGILGVLLAEQN